MKWYITAAIPYVNAKPHVGHALEFVQGDVLARFHRLLGDDVVYLTGSDENALKNVQAAEAQGLPVEEFCANNAKLFEELAKKLNVQLDRFQRSSLPNHVHASQELWRQCFAAGDIYEHEYEGKYCVGCEAFYTDDELVNGECAEHPGKPLQLVKEKNFFFRLSKYAKQIHDLIQNDTISIVPEKRKNEVLRFLEGEVNDFSVSRSRERARGWGIEVPNDPTQMMYVWFDALNVYQSGIGFGADEQKYQKYWPADVHLIGKGIIRFHAVYWIAILLSAGLQLPKAVYVHGYFTVDGQKMSKTLGNVIDPLTLADEVGVDAVRYYLLREISTVDDGDFSMERMHVAYKGELANELGNLVSRATTLMQGETLHMPLPKKCTHEITDHINKFELMQAMDLLWVRINDLNKEITEHEPWKMQREQVVPFMSSILERLLQIAFDLQPFLPNTAQ